MTRFTSIAGLSTLRLDLDMTPRSSRHCQRTSRHRSPALATLTESGELPNARVVLDIGCGAGTDLLLAARRVGPEGRAIGVDMTEAMRRRATAGAEAAGLLNVDVRDGDATRLPVDDHSIDVVISNGVLNLVPDKPRALAEIARVLRPGGRAQIADIVIGDSPARQRAS